LVLRTDAQASAARDVVEVNSVSTRL